MYELVRTVKVAGAPGLRVGARSPAIRDVDEDLADVVDAHAESLGVEADGALPGRSGITALVVGLES